MSPQEKEDALYSDELGKVDAEKYDGRDVAELMGVEYIESWKEAISNCYGRRPPQRFRWGPCWLNI